jgi:hypothetical protein
MMVTAPHPWDTAPTEALPLRAALPAISQTSRLLLHSWAWQQPGARGWLLQRQHDYWEAHREEVLARHADANAMEEWHSHVDAVCALDLLRWQCGCLDREAIEKLIGCAEVAELDTGAGRRSSGAVTAPTAPELLPARQEPRPAGIQ